MGCHIFPISASSPSELVAYTLDVKEVFIRNEVLEFNNGGGKTDHARRMLMGSQYDIKVAHDANFRFVDSHQVVPKNPSSGVNIASMNKDKNSVLQLNCNKLV